MLAPGGLALSQKDSSMTTTKPCADTLCLLGLSFAAVFPRASKHLSDAMMKGATTDQQNKANGKMHNTVKGAKRRMKTAAEIPSGSFNLLCP